MKTDEKDYTDRQIDLITTIGSDWRTKIDNELKNIVITNIVVFVFTSVIIWSMLFINRNIFILGVFFVPIIILSMIVDYVKKAKEFIKLKSQTDYTIGLFFMDRDPGVVGRSDKIKRKMKKDGFILTCLSSSMLIVFLVVFIVYGGNLHDYSSLTTITGNLDHIYVFNNDAIIFKLENDSTRYIVDPLYAKYIDSMPMIDNTQAGDDVVLFVDGKDSLVERNVYYAEISGVAYFDNDTMQLGLHDEMIIGYVMVGFVSIFWISGFLMYPIYKHFYYPKSKEKEKYNLDYTLDELNEIRIKHAENTGN